VHVPVRIAAPSCRESSVGRYQHALVVAEPNVTENATARGTQARVSANFEDLVFNMLWKPARKGQSRLRGTQTPTLVVLLISWPARLRRQVCSEWYCGLFAERCDMKSVAAPRRFWRILKTMVMVEVASNPALEGTRGAAASSFASAFSVRHSASRWAP
jgi:hypothetical protein